MKNLNVVIGVLVGAVIGFAVRSMMTNGPTLQAKAPVAANAPAAPAAPGADQVFKVQLGTDFPVVGDATAKVTIVEFSDFECPFCGRVIDTVKQIEKNYGSDVRVIFKNNPLPMHPNAPGAAKAALAAHKQGKFWQMHDKLFENNVKRQPNDKVAIAKIAQEIGLDLSKFAADADSPETQALVASDMAQARQLGASGTPAFFINGVKVNGAQPYDNFKRVIDAQLKRAEDVLSKGASKSNLYAELIKDGITSPPPPPAPPAPPPQARKIDVDPAAPAKGGKSPKVTIVMWSDFQCPYCSRVEPTVNQIMATYKDDVKVIWKNQPLSFHPNAGPAAKAAMAAHKQGKFWQMHDLMFANQQALSDAKYEEWAKQIGVNVAQWKKDKDSPEIAAAVTKDAAQGSQVGADGTPTFFINGKLISGAMPFDSFKTIIDEQLGKANAELKKGTPADKLYDVLTAENVKSAGAAPAPSAPAAPTGPVKIDIGSSPLLGDKNAPVTVVIWSDFQCPFCSRVEPTLEQVKKEYGKKVRFVWKNQPLSFHPNAMPAAEAAMAANDQGKFWEFHDKLFANQSALGQDLYDKTAKELGLDVKKWKATIEAGKYKAQIQADMAQGSQVGAGGTPTLFINGRKIVGAQPFDAFKQIIDAELAGIVAKK